MHFIITSMKMWVSVATFCILISGLRSHVAIHSNEGSVTQQSVANSLPFPPSIILIATSTRSLIFKIIPSPNNREPVCEYQIYYKTENGEWETIRKKNIADYYTIEELLCGTGYEVYVTAINSYGAGDKSEIISARTDGAKPKILYMMEIGSNYLILHLNAGSGGRCPISYMVIEYKKKTNEEWIVVKDHAFPNETLNVSDLEPSTSYQLRITAHTSVGSISKEEEFVTNAVSK